MGPEPGTTWAKVSNRAVTETEEEVMGKHSAKERRSDYHSQTFFMKKRKEGLTAVMGWDRFALPRRGEAAKANTKQRGVA
jgi:hypothetical protein